MKFRLPTTLHGKASMTSIRTTIAALAAFALICPAVPISARAVAQQCAQADNTAQNKNQNKTADNQPNAKSDRLTTANVRKAIIADKNLSMYAHNVKIITINGMVTLKGPVKSEDEKNQVATDAAGVVPAGSITNHLTVKQ
jgi:hyperosmotically inducible protein